MRFLSTLLAAPNDGDEGLLREQYRSLTQLTPVMYAVIIVVTINLVAIFHATTPAWLAFYLPGALSIVVLLRAIQLLNARKSVDSLTIEKLANRCRRLIVLGPLLSFGFSMIGVQLMGYGDATQQTLAIMLIWILAVISGFCTHAIPQASVAIVLASTLPMSVAFALSGNPVFSELVPVLNVVAGFVIYMLLEAYKNFAKIVRATEARLLAERANLAKSRFLSVISHELRTPLNAIIGYSEMLEENAQAGGRKNDAADLGRIGGAAHHLLKLINEVLDFSKIEAGAETVELAVVDVTAKAHAVADMIKPIMAANRVRFIVDVADLGSSYTDGFKLSQCLLNLLSNAAKFSGDGAVSFAARRIYAPAGDVLEFTVSDTGVGIAPELLGTLFEPFVQADASITRRFGGTGARSCDHAPVGAFTRRKRQCSKSGWEGLGVYASHSSAVSADVLERGGIAFAGAVSPMRSGLSNRGFAA